MVLSLLKKYAMVWSPILEVSHACSFGYNMHMMSLLRSKYVICYIDFCSHGSVVGKNFWKAFLARHIKQVIVEDTLLVWVGLLSDVTTLIP